MVPVVGLSMVMMIIRVADDDNAGCDDDNFFGDAGVGNHEINKNIDDDEDEDYGEVVITRAYCIKQCNTLVFIRT